MRRKVPLLRLVLPASRAGQDEQAAVWHAAWQDEDGRWQGAVHRGLAEVAACYDAKRLEACPHPVDVSMTQLELPPLPAKRLRAGVHGAVELMGLGSPGDLIIGHGAQDAAGRIPVAWMPSAVASLWRAALQRQGMAAPLIVLPPPAFLPLPANVDDASVALLDGWLIVRTGAITGDLLPLPAAEHTRQLCEQKLRDAMPAVQAIRWSDWPADAEDGIGLKSEVAPLGPPFGRGTGWNWTLSVTQGPSAGRAWVRPALGWGLAVAAVWVVALNLHAARVAGQGRQLSRQMAEQVKAAFPHVSVVLNPLQQARQLVEARRAGTGAADEAGQLAGLLRATAALLTQSSGQVRQVTFEAGTLYVQWRQGAVMSPGELEALQSRAQERGLGVQAEPDGVRFAVSADGTNANGQANGPANTVEPRR